MLFCKSNNPICNSH